MKRIISTILALVLTLSSFCLFAVAEESADLGTVELENVATKGLAYCSSMKNSNWTPPSSINNGFGYLEDWHGWEPKYPSIEPGQNTANGFDGEYCGIKFLNREYYEIHEIKMSVGLHALYKQNVTYTIQMLVEGVWQDVAVITDSQANNIGGYKEDKDGDKTQELYYKYSSYEDAMQNDTSNYHIGAELYLKLDQPVTTNNVRIQISDFAKNYPGGDVLIFPYIYEVELIGKLGVTPTIDLPEGAEFSQNASYNSIPYATSSQMLKYPFLAIDKKEETAWQPESLEAGQTLELALDKKYTVDKLTLNFGAIKEGEAPVSYEFALYAFVDGSWQKVADGSSYNQAENTYITEYPIATPIQTDRVRLVFENELASAPSVYEFEVNIVGEKTYFLESRFTGLQKSSSAKGNLAILGEAYASANILPYSDPMYINDGKYFADSEVWFPGSLTIPVTCGVKLDQEYSINKVVVYCATPEQIGWGVTRFNIIAKINGVSTVVATGDSYNPDKMIEGIQTRYATIYEFPEGIVTDDISIEFIRGSGTIPNVMELEVYSDTQKCSMFDGYPTQSKAPEYVDVVHSEPEPEPTPTPTPDPDPTQPTPTPEPEESNIGIIVGVSLCGVAVLVSCISICVAINAKKKSKSAEEKDESTQNNDEK